MQLIFIILFFTISLFSKTIIDVSVFNHPPLIYSKTDEKPQGVFIDVLEEVAKKNNWELVFHHDSFSNNLKKIDNETTDLLVAFADSKERRKIYDFTDDTVISTWVQVFSIPSLKINTFNDLENRTVAGINGYIQFKKFSEKMKELGLKFKTYEVATVEEAFNAVENGKADVLITEYFSSINYIQNTTLIKQPIIFYPYGTTYGTKKGTNQHIIQAINNYFKEQKKNPYSNYYKSIEKWLGLTYSKEFTENISSAIHKNLRVLVLKDWKPYYFIDEQGKPSGYAIELFEKIASNINLKYEYVIVENWNEGMKLVREGRIDIVPNMGEVLKRTNYVDFTQTTDLFDVGLFKHKELVSVNSLKDIKNKKVGFVNNNICSKLISKDITNNKIEFLNIYSALSALENQKIDALCYPKITLLYLIKELRLNNIENFEKPLKVINRAIGIKKGNEELVKLFDNEFLKLKVNTEYQKLYTKWFLIDKQIQFSYEEMIKIIAITIVIILLILYYLKRKNLIMTKKELFEKTEQIKKEQKIHKLYLDTMNTIVVVLDVSGTVIMINKYGLNTLGFKENELIGKNWFEVNVIPKPQLKKVQEYFNNIINKKENLNDDIYENELIDSLGNSLIFNWSSSLLIDNDRLKGVISTGVNVTNEKRQQTIITDQAKLVSMGEMIGNIAHQWRQPLSVITTGATGMKVQKEMDLLTDKDFYENCDAINNNAQYLSKTIDDFRSFIKGERIKKIFSLSDDIDSFLHLIEGTIKKNDINLVSDLDDKIKINGYENELIQCFINIFNNAKDALVENKIENKLIVISTTREKNKAIIKIKDNAGGIPKEIINKIFEPYFTTKHSSIGTGLGLHMTYNLIVEGMKGIIEVNNVRYKYEDKKYEGAEFTITLPLK